MSNHSGTYRTLLNLTPEQEEFLSGYTTHYNLVERRLYADMQRFGKSAAEFKNAYLSAYQITARQFNAIGRNLEGKISSVLELLKNHKDDLEADIAKTGKVIKKIRNKDTKHQKQRRLFILQTRLADVNQQMKDGDPRLCFGSRKMFYKQYNLEVNGYCATRFRQRHQHS